MPIYLMRSSPFFFLFNWEKSLAIVKDFNRYLTDPNPDDSYHHIEPFTLRPGILVAPHPVLFVIPVRPAGGVHASTAAGLPF